MNKPNNTTEIITICSALAAFLAGTGIINIDFQHIVETTKQVKDISNDINLASINSIIEGIYKIVCIFLGGSIITHYIRYKKAKDASIIIQKIQKKLEGEDFIIKTSVEEHQDNAPSETEEPHIKIEENSEEQEIINENENIEITPEEVIDENENIEITPEEIDTSDIEEIPEDPEENEENPDNVIEDVGDDNVTYPLKRV